MLLYMLPHHSQGAIYRRAYSLGLWRGMGLPGRPSMKERILQVLENFPRLPRKLQAQLAGCTVRTVQKYANTLGVNKKRPGRP
jgi:hypothetical protein